MKAIVVDDEPWMLCRFKDVSKDIEEIELLGDFDTPVDALEFAATSPIELAFLDIEMPKLNGIQLAQKLREIKPDIYIVLISAYDSAVVCAKKGDLQCEYMMKPYDENTLKKVVASLLK